LPVVLAGALATLLLAGTAAAHALARNERAARRDARALLDLVRLPTGAVRSATEPAGGGIALARPGYTTASSALVDRHAWWTVPGSFSNAAAFVKAHPPTGAKRTTTGSAIQSGSITETFVGFSLPTNPVVLWQRQLVVVIAQLPDGVTGIRVDAEVEWTVPRPAGERVPRAADLLTVTRGTMPGWPPPVSRTVTDRARIRRVAAMLDRLPVVQPVAVACPALFAEPTITLTFLAGPGGPRLARATMPADGPEGSCAPIVFAVRGRQERPLYAFPSFRHRVSKALGISLR
jgi:hypothetical protein